ncbi:putative phosphodiesterase [Paenochrobactrum gallinarii]|uniref:Putative phosphodiesterase n=1 Tax=Paenochrobactrum gallinarii TaxID=643673 RepID=A0A841LV40_9HYPH|nr:metallophosphoesterase [Paenochrobactrum gallinarii]MBB6262215.1 putative phosphodiesterase [Paenochrobactrum gallinarii]
MKFWVFSDIHIEINSRVSFPSNPPEVDAILIAGDLNYASEIQESAKFVIDHYNLPVIFVAGNHEFYQQTSMPHATHEMEMAELASRSEDWKQRFYFLNRKTIVLGDTRIIGATLWTDFELATENWEDAIWRLNKTNAINDFHAIQYDKNQIFRPNDMLQLFQADQTYIKEQLMVPFDGTTVVMTHHLPHPFCVAPEFKDDEHSYLFACSEKAFEQLLHSETAPHLWVHGHTHTAMDVTVENTRIVCNPHGYDHENGINGFVWDKVVDTDALSDSPLLLEDT